MSDEQNEQVDKTDIITPAERRNIWIWAFTLVVLFAAATVLTAWAVYSNKIASIKQHSDRMNPEVGEGGTEPPPTEPPAGANHVRAGIYVDHIIDLSVKEASWPVDFYLWFRWNGTGEDPGENFQIVDGSIESKEKVEEYTSGGERYVLYRVVARITKFFDVSRFPRDDHVLTINIESPASERRELLFVADTENSGLSSRVRIPGYSIYKQAVIEKPHAYSSTHGDPRLAAGTEKVQSQLRMGIWIYRQGSGFYWKMFIALFVAVGVAMLAFFIKPTDVDPRFGLGVGALGAVLVNTFVTSSLVPDTGVITLGDIVNQVGIVTIFLTLLQSAISLYLFERKGKKTLSRLFDRVSFPIFLAGYSAINLTLPWSATLWGI
ncbi:MAG: hypothetical protein M3388_11770 [Acidobacteriota bacterium]|nr:hypothetical protein [Acidobacteriota bacterium]